MEWTLDKYNGMPANQTVQVRKGTVEDVEKIYALQQQVHAAMPNPALYIPSAYEELLWDFTHSLCVCVWAKEEPIAYFILRYCGEDSHNYANYLDVPKEDLHLWANADSVVVADAYRGNRLQQKLFEVAMQWRLPSIIGIGCTISPDNAYSLNNAKALGFTVHTRRIMYGKHDRFVLKNQLTPLCGRYRHFKGMEYRVLSIAQHSETQEPMVVYQALYGEQGIWVRPASMWFEHIDRDNYHGPRFYYVGND